MSQQPDRPRIDLDGLVLVAVQLAAVRLLPTVDFPLNDDWSYAATALRLAETGRFEPGGFTSMPLVAQAAWGALWCGCFGFSHAVLAWSTRVLAWLGILATLALLRAGGADRPTRLVGAALVGFCPLYFQLGSTFMTDVPFAAVSAMALLMLLRAGETRGRWALVVGCALVAAAVLIRQLGLFVAIVYLVLELRGPTRRPGRAVLPLLVGLVALVGFGAWMAAAGRVPKLYHHQLEVATRLFEQPVGTVTRTVVSNGLSILVYLGLFTAPLAIPAWLPTLRGAGRVAGLTAALLAVGLAGWMVVTERMMPYAGNLLFDCGLGPITLVGDRAGWPTAPAWVWGVVSAVSILGAVTWLQLAARAVRGRLGLGLAVGLAAYAAPLLLAGLFDRYVLAMLPPALLLVVLGGAPIRGRAAWSVAAVGTILPAVFGVAATHDYLAWNTARWELAADLAEAGWTPAQIDGGFEYCGWHLYRPDYVERPGVSWWWVVGDEVVLSLSEQPGRRVIAERAFRRWLPPGQGRLLALRAEGGGP